jgi:hypothetical protein
MKRSIVALLLVALAGFGFADNLLVNGDFEESLSVGWTDTIVGTLGYGMFTWSDTLGQPSPGFAAAAYKTLLYYSSLSQTVSIPNTNVRFDFDGRLRIGGGSSTCWPTAAFMVTYFDGAGTSLGNTRIYLHDQYNTWVNSDTQHLIEATAPEVWTQYSLNVADELSGHLPGINPAGVAQLRFELFAYDNGT